MLTDQQRLFVLEYLKDLNATKAAIRAGYSPKCAHSRGSKLMSTPEVRAEIQKAMDKRARKLELTTERVLEEIAAIAFANPADLIGIGEDGELKPLQGISADTWRALGVSEIGPDGIKLRQQDKLKALDMAAKHLRLYGDDDADNVTLVIKNYAGAKATATAADHGREEEDAAL